MALSPKAVEGLCGCLTHAAAALLHQAQDDEAWERWARWAAENTGEQWGPGDRIHAIESARLLSELVESLRVDSLERQLLDYLAQHRPGGG